MRSFSGAQAKQYAVVRDALDGLSQRRGRLDRSDLSNDPDWQDLTRRFLELTGMTVGRYCRALRESGDEMPEPAAELIRAMLGKLNGPSAYGSPAASD